MDRWKRRGGKSQRGEEHKREDQRRVGGKKMQVREKLAMSRSTLFDFPMICGSGGSKSRLAKAAGAEPSGQMRDEKLHAVVARSKFASEEAINTAGSEHFWKLRCRKSARRCGAKEIYKSRCTKHTMLGALFEIVMACRCGAKHISKSKCAKHTMLGALLEVEMSKKCRPLWREAHFQVNMFKTPHAGTTYEGSDVVLRGRRKGFCALPKVSETRGFCSMSKRLSVISTPKFQLD